MAVDLYSVVLFGGICGQPVNNVLHFNGSETGAANPVQGGKDLNAYLGDGTGAGTYTKLFLDCLPQNYTLLGLRARRINNGGGPTVTTTFTPIVGNRVGDSDVSGIGPVGLYHGTPGLGVWITGKIFFPGVSNADIANNSFVDALRDAIGDFLDLSLSAAGPGPNGPWQQQINHQADNTAINILDYSVSKKVGTQRRRYVPI